MSLFKEVLEQIKLSQAKEFNCLSWEQKLPRFSQFVPGVSKGLYYAVTGAPGAAKTQFTDNLFLYHAVDFCSSHNIPLEIVYFSFEISSKAKLLQGISKRLFDAYGVKIPPSKLMKKTNLKLNETEWSKLEKAEKYFETVEQYVTFIDDALTPSQILKVQTDKMFENGTYDNRTGLYTPNDPEKYIIFITDHISLIQPEAGQTLHMALATFSRNNIMIKNKFGATVVNIHQQGVEGQVEQFTNKGDNIASKVEPKLAGLGDNRTLGRDYDMVLGLFSPKRHEIDFHRGYKTKQFGDNCRFLSIVKNREGEQDKSIALYFDGAVGYFEELPKAEEFLVMKLGIKADNTELYEKYAKGLVGILNPNTQKTLSFS